MAELQLTDITKIYDKKIYGAKNISFTVKDKEFAVLVGPSGCGKTTILRLIAGLEEATSGEILIDGRSVSRLSPKDRDIAMVFQNYALYPHMDVFENMAFGLKMRQYPRHEVRQRVLEAADILGIRDLLDRKPRQLSGGQRQRVAVGRAIVRQPRLFLFDEPLSNLDAKLRVQMRAELSRLHKRFQATIIYVTHDQVEAMTLGEKIIVLNDGVMQQVADPTTLYRYPRNKFVAGFIGSPPMNFVAGKIKSEGNRARFYGSEITLALNGRSKRLRDQSVIIGIRPVDFSVSGSAEIKIIVDVVEPLGDEYYVYGRCGENMFSVRLPEASPPRIGDQLTLRFNPEKVYLFDATTEESLY